MNEFDNEFLLNELLKDYEEAEDNHEPSELLSYMRLRIAQLQPLIDESNEYRSNKLKVDLFNELSAAYEKYKDSPVHDLKSVLGTKAIELLEDEVK